MRTVVVPLKRVDTVKLKAELIAAGVPEWPGTLTEPTYASPALLEASRGMSSPIMSIDVPDGSDPATVREVVSQHIDERTDGQRKADKARRLIAEKGFSADDPLAILVRALVLVVADLQNENAARVAARQPLRTLTPKQIHAAIRNKFGSLTE